MTLNTDSMFFVTEFLNESNELKQQWAQVLDRMDKNVIRHLLTLITQGQM